jgi:hypothetical protein
MYRAKSFEYLALIADDKTPVFDAENKKWVAWVDEDEKKKVEQEAAQQLKEQPKPESKPATQPVVEEPEEELPF